MDAGRGETMPHGAKIPKYVIERIMAKWGQPEISFYQRFGEVRTADSVIGVLD